MPDNRRVAGPEESFSPLLYASKEQKVLPKPLVMSNLNMDILYFYIFLQLGANGKRLDERGHKELRPIRMLISNYEHLIIPNTRYEHWCE